MRVGLLIGAPAGRTGAERVASLQATATLAEEGNFATVWIPQVPGRFDALTSATLLAQATERVELATAVLPIQTRHPVALAQQVLAVQAACAGRFTLGIGPSHHWVVEEQLGVPYERPAALVRDYLDVLDVALGPGDTIDVENSTFRVHSPIDGADRPTPVLLAALAPLMLDIAGSRTAGTILWMADERAIAEHILPRIARAASAAGRRAPRIVASVPVTVCADNEIGAARALANATLGSADLSPNYRRLLSHGNAKDIGDVLVAGDENAVARRLAAFRDAGVTDLAARVLPFGASSGDRRVSRQRTETLLRSLTPAL